RASCSRSKTNTKSSAFATALCSTLSSKVRIPLARICLPFPFRDLDPLDRWGSMLAGLRTVEQRLEVRLQIDRVLLCALPVDTSRPIFPCASVRLTEPVQVDVVR